MLPPSPRHAFVSQLIYALTRCAAPQSAGTCATRDPLLSECLALAIVKHDAATALGAAPASARLPRVGATVVGVSEAAPRVVTYAEYLVLEEAAETKHEYVRGEIRAMSGGTTEHARLQSRAVVMLEAALVDKPCEPFTSDLRVYVAAADRSAYPDVTVVCDQVERAALDPNAATNPAVIVEVLSPSSEADDRGDKWADYQRLPSLKHYVLVSQHRPRVEVFTRTDLGWHYAEVLPGGAIDLSALRVSLPLDALYATRLGA